MQTSYTRRWVALPLHWVRVVRAAVALLIAMPLAGCLPDFPPPADGQPDGGGDPVDMAQAPMGGSGPGGAFHDSERDITVAAMVPTWQDTTIASFTTQNETLSMMMNHQAAHVVSAAFSACSNCHVNADSGVFYPGVFHSTLANLMLPAPSQCADCHAPTMPTGFVGPMASTRSPASGEMHHDAVVWQNGQPTTTPIVTQDCSTCHTSPTQAADATWASGASFHAPLGSTQPASCIDCHANTRPTAVLTSASASLPAKLQFDHQTPAAMGDCSSCHQQTSSWSGGAFHAAGSPAPSTCLPCHAGERPTSNAGWASATYMQSPFDYGTNAAGITHGDGQDCATCHKSPGMTWADGHFAHGSTTVSKSTCIACHSTQRPDLQPGATAAGTATLLGFDHSINGTGDCFGCHQATVTANTYTTYKVPGGDWKGGVAYPGSTLISSATQFITVNELKLNKTGTRVTSTTAVTETLYNQMLHVSGALPATLNAGPTNNPDPTKCWHCHTNTNGTVTAYANGQYHSALTNYSATPGGAATPLPQPTTLCLDCHVNMAPANVVEKAASDLQAMDHAQVAGTQCASCHKSPGSTWADGSYHANIGATVPADCTSCHYPLMADTTKSDLTNGTLYKMLHASTQVTVQNCQTCHTGALAKATTVASTQWSGGALHPNVAAQPTACVDCHTVTRPAASTQSSIAYTLAAGGTTTNGAQWMSHGSSQVGVECATCHLTDAKASGAVWSKSTSFHGKVAATTCRECHGLTNGGGSVPGTKNNMPAGLTDSTTVTSAASDATTGVAAGTHDQISHADVNVTNADCKLCHTQVGPSATTGVQGKEWAQAKFHANFSAANPLVMNGSTGRCSNCHLNVKPGAGFAGYDHTSLTNAAGSTDCSACHSWPGTGTASAPNWLGAAGGQPQYLNVGGFTILQPPAPTATTQRGISNLPHPTVGSGTACTTCHATTAGGKNAMGYDHASSLINGNCSSCHEAGSNLVGTAWNNSTTQSAGAGDTRPYTLSSVVATRGGSQLTVTYKNHFYPVDCYQCHNAPTGIVKTQTGTAYTSAWTFPHSTSRMTNPSTCVMCHTNGVPN